RAPPPGGTLTPGQVRAALRRPSPFHGRTSLVSVENTHSAAGGRIRPLETMREIGAVAREHGLPVHLDGARLWNAAVATGVPESAWAAEADPVMVTLSKGLGCPAGSLLAGDAGLTEQAWRIPRRLRGGMP